MKVCKTLECNIGDILGFDPGRKGKIKRDNGEFKKNDVTSVAPPHSVEKV